jgi:seryl-tRNA synthetase
MPRPKGPGAIKFLDVTTQDDVAMRKILRRGAPPTPEEHKLNELRARRVRLMVELTNLHTKRRMLREALAAQTKAGFKTTLAHAKSEGQARNELRTVETEIERKEKALHDTDAQIEEAREQVSNHLPSSSVFPWQERAVELMALHKYLDADSDHVCSPAGSRITTQQLQAWLHAEGYHVDERQLRRFMRWCGVAGQQGKRMDLPNK